MTEASTSSRPLSTFGSRTDVGKVRDHNEDSLAVSPPLFAVADGMGGHAAGEVASEIAIDVLTKRAPERLDAEALSRAVEEANLEVISAASDGRGREGMGTTLTAAMVSGERVIIAQVGDSRAYLLHQGNLQQITRDHSLMADLIEAGQITPEEARFHPNRSVITRALGSNANMHPDIYEINVQTGDRLLLCSDGLSSMIEDSVIEKVLSEEPDPQECASALVDEALDAGGYDNITVIVADIEGFSAQRTRKVARKTFLHISFVAILLISVIVGACCAFNWWAQNAAFLVEENGTVAVYSGVPGEFMGLRFNNLDHTTDIAVDSLSPTVAERLRNGGVTCDTLAEANELVNSWKANATTTGVTTTPTSDQADNTNKETAS